MYESIESGTHREPTQLLHEVKQWFEGIVIAYKLRYVRSEPYEKAMVSSLSGSF